MTARSILASLVALVATTIAVLAVLLPGIASTTLLVLAKVSFGAGTTFTAASAWLQRNSDNATEKAAWSLTFLAGLTLIAWSFYHGWANIPGPVRLALILIIGASALFFVLKADDEDIHGH